MESRGSGSDASIDRDRRRLEARAALRRRRTRRRSVFLAIDVALVAGGVVLGIFVFGGSSATDSSPTRPAAPPRPASRTQPKPKPRSGRGLPSLAAQKAEVARLVRIGLPVFCGGRTGRYVALTFDDGPGPYTPLALRILRSDHARATFFVVGEKVSPFRSLLPQEAELAALGDHTWTHPDLTRLTPSRSWREIADTKHAIELATGQAPLLFRPPYGARDATVDEEARRLGLLEIIWDIASGDSEGANWLGIARNVSTELHPGAIIGLHENRGQTIRALKFLILPELRRRGYTTVTVPELLALDPPSIRQLRSGESGCVTSEK